MIELWGAVLDRSFEQIVAASEDGREFDRQLVVRVSDVWDNNTYPFFGAAVLERRGVNDWPSTAFDGWRT